MTPTQQGAFCQKCVKHVHDFTNKSSDEIKQTLRSLIGQSVCARLTTTQEATLNAEFEAWASFRSKRSFQSALVFSLIVVFGLTLFSCEHEQDKKQIEQLQATALKAMTTTIGNVSETAQPVEIQNEAPALIAPECEAIMVGSLSMTPEQMVMEDMILIEDHYSIAGGIGYSTHYVDYLQEVVPEPVEEVDPATGRIFPQTWEAIAFPNPTNGTTTLEIAAPSSGQFEIALYDMSGKVLQTVYSGEIGRGYFQSAIDLSDYVPGMYIVAIVSKEFKETVRISKI